MNTPNCRQIVVIPDGWGTDGGREFEAIVARAADPRVELTRLPRAVHALIHGIQKRRSKHGAANWLHWAMIVEGASCSSSEYAFLHDADAFFIDADGLERQYAEAASRGMFTLGVQYRIDPFFAKVGRRLPGTWEMMFSVPWARGHTPYSMKGQWQRHAVRPPPIRHHALSPVPRFPVREGRSDGESAEIGPFSRYDHNVSCLPRNRSGVSVVDTAFRLLLLSILQELLPPLDGTRILPSPRRIGPRARQLHLTGDLQREPASQGVPRFPALD